MGVVDDLARARDAYERREWVAAYEVLSGIDGSVLQAHDFAHLGTAALLLGRRNDCIQALQRGYQAHLEAGATLDAVRAGFWLAKVLTQGGEPAIGGAWLARAQRLLDDVPGDVVERGYLLNQVMLQHIFGGDFELALAEAVEVTDYGRRFNEPDLLSNGLNAQGRILLYSGRVPEGLALLDEAMLGLSTGEVSPVFAGEVYCSLVEACQEVSDYGRAAEWTRALTSWVEAQPGLVAFAGQCAVHRGQIMRVRGAFADAIQEFDRSVERYAAAGTLASAGVAMAEAGGVHRILGDLDAADAAYERAIGYGFEPQPGLAILWLARGRTEAALNAVRRLLEEPRDPVHRSQLLPGSVEVLLGSGHIDEARKIAAELSGVAESFGCTALRAMAHYAEAACLVATDDPSAALSELRMAVALWRSLEAPYEVARCRHLTGRALRLLDDEDSALAELSRALKSFQELGAARAAAEVTALVARSLPRGLTEREVEVLRLVAGGRSNTEIAAVLVLSDKTVARHLSNIFTKLDVSSRTAAAAFAFENKLV